MDEMKWNDLPTYGSSWQIQSRLGPRGVWEWRYRDIAYLLAFEAISPKDVDARTRAEAAGWVSGYPGMKVNVSV